MNGIESILRQGSRLSLRAADKEYAFLQHLLLVSSSIFGILISLHPNTPEYLYSRWVFVLSALTLGAAILCNTVALYAQSRLVRRTQKMLSEEGIAAIHEKRHIRPVRINKLRYHVFCEIATYVLLLIALVLLCVYAVCKSFGL